MKSSIERRAAIAVFEVLLGGDEDLDCLDILTSPRVDCWDILASLRVENWKHMMSEEMTEPATY